MDDDEEKVSIAVHINKQFEATNNINPSQDLCKLAEVDKNDVSIAQLRKDIIYAFGRSKSITSLFNNANYEWKIYSYHSNKAEVEIEDDDDLETEIDEFCPSDDESDDLFLRDLHSNVC